MPVMRTVARLQYEVMSKSKDRMSAQSTSLSQSKCSSTLICESPLTCQDVLVILCDRQMSGNGRASGVSQPRETRHTFVSGSYTGLLVHLNAWRHKKRDYYMLLRMLCVLH
jgi:hypothetical protein